MTVLCVNEVVTGYIGCTGGEPVAVEGCCSVVWRVIRIQVNKALRKGRLRMLNRIRTVGESFSNQRERTVNLIQDGTNGQYARLDGKWYLLTSISDEKKNELVDHWLPQIDYLRDLVECHRDTANHLQPNVTDDTTEFQHIIIFHHVSIAHFLSDALSPSGNGIVSRFSDSSPIRGRDND